MLQFPLELKSFTPYGLKIVIFITLLLLFAHKTVLAAPRASFSLLPSSGTYKPREEFEIAVILDTGGGETAGSDIFLTFTKENIKLEEIREGSVYDQYVGKRIDNGIGLASISGIAPLGKSLFSGRGTFATLKFLALKEGNAEVRFEFTPGSVNDTNITDYNLQSDILSSVTNGFYQLSLQMLVTESPQPTASPTSSAAFADLSSSESSIGQRLSLPIGDFVSRIGENVASSVARVSEKLKAGNLIRWSKTTGGKEQSFPERLISALPVISAMIVVAGLALVAYSFKKRGKIF